MGQSNQYSNNYREARVERVAVLLSVEEIDLLRSYAEDVGSSMSEVIREKLGSIIMSEEQINAEIDKWADGASLIGDAYRQRLKDQLRPMPGLFKGTK